MNHQELAPDERMGSFVSLPKKSQKMAGNVSSFITANPGDQASRVTSTKFVKMSSSMHNIFSFPKKNYKLLLPTHLRISKKLRGKFRLV